MLKVKIIRQSLIIVCWKLQKYVPIPLTPFFKTPTCVIAKLTEDLRFLSLFVQSSPVNIKSKAKHKLLSNILPVVREITSKQKDRTVYTKMNNAMMGRREKIQEKLFCEDIPSSLQKNQSSHRLLSLYSASLHLFCCIFQKSSTETITYTN